MIEHVSWQQNLGNVKEMTLSYSPSNIGWKLEHGEKNGKSNWQNIWIGDLTMGECENRQRKSYNIETNCKHSKGGYGKLPLGNVYTCHGFF